MKTASEYDWAIGAATKDATYLISPTARRRAMDILDNYNTPRAIAAKVILKDGRGQQEGPPSMVSMDTWREAAELLGVFDDF